MKKEKHHSITDKNVIGELRAIAEKYGLITPQAVIERARNPNSSLHSKFEWDDTLAAEKWRIEQARRLLQVTIEYIGENPEPVRAFVSLVRDRSGDDTGYRVTSVVVSDKELYAEMLRDAVCEMRVFEQKYRRVKELRHVFAAMKKVN